MKFEKALIVSGLFAAVMVTIIAGWVFVDKDVKTYCQRPVILKQAVAVEPIVTVTPVVTAMPVVKKVTPKVGTQSAK